MTASDNELGPGDHTHSLEGDKRTRPYLVHVPPKYDLKKPTPIVLVFHGGGRNAKQTEFRPLPRSCPNAEACNRKRPMAFLATRQIDKFI
jgi:hypothetical protein